MKRKKPLPQERMATLAEWHEWLRVKWPPPVEVLRVLMDDFEREKKKICPERLNELS